MENWQIKAMLSPSAYQEETGQISLIQTHVSYLFLTDRYVYKVKKAVNLGFLDFTCLDQRRFFCEEELRLNRRLSPDVYLGVVAITAEGEGMLAVDGPGVPFEYAVKMVRLPEERMMSNLLDSGSLTESDLHAVAAKVAAFHAAAATSYEISRYGEPETIRQNWLENLSQTEPFIGLTLSSQMHSQIGMLVQKHLESLWSGLKKRVTNGFIRECDGDLHCGNICLDGQVHIFDCIEFSERFRCSDTAADIAFLAMDLENHGRRDLAEDFIDEYLRLTGDQGMLPLLPLYLANRAFIRGKVEGLRLRDTQVSEDDKSMAMAAAKRFFRLSRGYLLRGSLQKSLIITCGLTGCGKSFLADELSFQLGVDCFSSDKVRKGLAGIPSGERGDGIYGSSWNQATYSRLAEKAETELHGGRSVIVDATFRKAEYRDIFRGIADKQGAGFVILQLVCDDLTAKDRLHKREKEGGSVSDGTWQVYLGQKKDFEEPSADEGVLVQLNAVNEPSALVEETLKAILPGLAKVLSVDTP